MDLTGWTLQPSYIAPENMNYEENGHDIVDPSTPRVYMENYNMGTVCLVV